MSNSSRLDLIQLEILQGALRSIQGEMEALIEQTAMSAFIREKKDYFAAIFDHQGRLVAGRSLPFSVDLIEPVIAHYPAETMKKGDVYWYNDCYASSGAVSHTPDQVFVTPVFGEDGLVGFAQTWAHFNDIGGMRAGSISPDCTDIFQEGVIIPPVRIVTEGHTNVDLLRIFFRNSRFPAIVQGDTRALMAATRVGERRLEELIHRFGAAPLREAFGRIIERTARALTARLHTLIPPGSYRFTDTIDSDGQGHGPIKLRYQLNVTDDRVVLDTSDSDDQVPGPVNYLMSRTAPAMILGAYLLGDSRGLFLNAGALQLIDEVVFREGSIFRPRFPAPLGQRGVTLMRNLAACLGLLNVATGGAAPASHSAYVIWYVRGLNEHGEPFLMSDGVGVGYGARPTADGHDAIYLVAQENYPAEFVESAYPLRVRRYAINTDSGGPGRWRGGCGVVREVEILAPEGVVSVRLDTIENPPWGVGGGQAARPGRCIVNPGREDERILRPLSDGNRVARGDLIRIETGGGGGWGHPFDREAEKVLADVLGGFVSRESAERDYGVALTQNSRAIDAEETRKLRLKRPAVKLFHRHGYCETLA